MGVRIKKDGMAGGWFWTLPKVPYQPEGAEHANFPNVATSAPSALLAADEVEL
jgi:hypothetical protein